MVWTVVRPDGDRTTCARTDAEDDAPPGGCLFALWRRPGMREIGEGAWPRTSTG